MRDVDYTADKKGWIDTRPTMVQWNRAKSERIVSIKKHINAALLHGYFQREGGVSATKRYKLKWQAQLDGGELREQPEEWVGCFTSFSDGLKLIEPGAVHSLCISSKGAWGELIDVIDIQF